MYAILHLYAFILLDKQKCLAQKAWQETYPPVVFSSWCLSSLIIGTNVLVQYAARPLPTEDQDPVAEARQHTAPDLRQEPTFHVPDFGNFKEAHSAKSNLELIRAYGVFTACHIRPIVNHADSLLNFSQKVLGTNITNALVRKTFFAHFCAGRMCS